MSSVQSPKRVAALRRVAIVLLTLVMFVASPITAWAATSITLTLVRHAQSLDNVVHVLGTVAPGPDLSPQGFVQAQALRDTLATNGIAYDAIYASTLIRTQQTATPYADYRGMTITVLDGLREVRAGADEGAITKPVDARMQNYIDVQDAWRSGWQLSPMPQDPNPVDLNPLTNANGDLNGIVFDDRTNNSIQKIYWDEINRYPTFTADAVNPEANPLAFSHNGTITSWVLMNVDNPDFAVISSNSLKNTGQVVVVGNPIDGWTLVSWAGVPVNATPSLGTALLVDFRNYSVVWQRAAWNVAVAQATGDPAQILGAIGAGTSQIVTATLALPGEVVRDVTDAVVHAIKPAGAAAPQISRVAAVSTTPVLRASGAATARSDSTAVRPNRAVGAATGRSADTSAAPSAAQRASKTVSVGLEQRRGGGAKASAAAASESVQAAA